MIPSVEIANVSELIAHIANLQAKQKTIFWFRGQRDASWNVSAGVFRDDHAEHERNYVHRFRSRAGTRYAHLPRQDELAMWLSLMQHYGLPTRLLDWSRSPLIASYFAMEEALFTRTDPTTDAAIWVLEPHELNVIECGEDVTPNLDARMCEPFVKPAFTHRSREEKKVLAVMAPEHDLRMFVQQGCFTIHSDQTPFDLRPKADRYLHKLVIPKSAVKSFGRDLEVCGFRKGDIFPDLGNLATELRVTKGQ